MKRKMKMTLKDFGEDRAPLGIRILLAPIRLALLVVMVIPAILIQLAGEEGLDILDFIADAGNE